jgi:hypothetical protein
MMGRSSMYNAFKGFAISTGVVVLAACGSTKSEPTPSPVDPVTLGSTVHVAGTGSAFAANDESFDGAVLVDGNPVTCVRPDGVQVLALHVQVTPVKGKIPTSSFLLETENAVPIAEQALGETGVATPPLGPEVSADAKGYITFEIPRRTKATVLDLYASQDTTGSPIAKWSLGELAPPAPCPSA